MSEKWLRKCRLVLGSNEKQIDLSEMRIRFNVEMSDGKIPNTADILVTNLSKQTTELIQKEFDMVTLDVGYEGGYALIFKGNVVQKRAGWESATDSFLDIVARDFDRGYNRASVVKTLSAGHTFRDQVNVALDAFKPFGISVGYIADLGAKKMPSSRVMFGMARDVLDTVALSTGTSWSIQNGVFQMVENDRTLPGDAIVLNGATGLISRPTQTIYGVEGRALIDPKLRIGSRVQIKTSSITPAAQGPLPENEAAFLKIPPLSRINTYKLAWINFVGDTRGQEWYADFIGVDADPNGRISTELTSRGISIPG